jgi:hypothetical protein
MQGLYRLIENLFNDIPFALVIFSIREAITHQMDFTFVFFAIAAAFFIHSHAIVFPGQVSDQCGQSRRHIVQPFTLAFLYKRLAHAIDFMQS